MVVHRNMAHMSALVSWKRNAVIPKENFIDDVSCVIKDKPDEAVHEILSLPCTHAWSGVQ